MQSLFQGKKINKTQKQAQMKISDFYKKDTEPEKFTGALNMNKIKMNMETKNRKQFQAENCTLNEKLVHGIKAGNSWALRVREKEDLVLGEKNHELPPLQDIDSKPIMFGADVKSLYPNLDGVNVAKVAGDAVRSTKIKFTGINFLMLSVYLLLVMGRSEMEKAGLGSCIPNRRKGDKSQARSLSANLNRNMDMWDFQNVQYTEKKKVEMIAYMVQISVLVLISSTCYSFGGQIYRQLKGLGIGLRASAALARITMCDWDNLWANRQWKLGLKVQIYFRYIDDLRFYLFPLTRGWRWLNSAWTYVGDSDNNGSTMAHTVREVGNSLNDIWEFIECTTECEEDFDNSYLATLDFQTKVDQNGIVHYKYYSKPMSNDRVLELGTSLSNNCIFSSLRQDLVRRLYTTGLMEPLETRMEIINNYIQLLVNSNHKFSYIKAIILQGLSKFNYMMFRNSLQKDHKLYSPLHRSRKYKYVERRLQKYAAPGCQSFVSVSEIAH